MEAKIVEMINEAVLYMVDNYDDEWALDIQTILEKHLSQEQEELDKRDNDLCNIHNSELSRSDMYMEIIWYLVNKWFLQEEYKA